MVSPSQRRHAVQGVVAAGICSSRQACRRLGLARSSFACRRKPPGERSVQTEEAIVELSRKHPRYGYRGVHAMVLRRGPSCARSTVQRVRRREGLRVLGSARRPRRPARPETKIKTEGVNDVWCVDLVFVPTRHGVTLTFLTVADQGSHYCIDISAGRRMTARDVVRALDEAARHHGALQRARLPLAERRQRKLQRPLPRRVPRPRTAGKRAGGTGDRPCLPRRLQRHPSPQQPGLSRAVRGPRRPIEASSKP
jgi:putative transposase